MSGSSRAMRWLIGLAFPLALVVGWQIAADARVLSPVFFPAPSRALGVLIERIGDGSIWPPIVATLWRMLVGWLLAGLAAGAPASSSFGGAGLKESRIFSAATQSWAQICGICSKTVSAGNRSFIKCGMRCWRRSP